MQNLVDKGLVSCREEIRETDMTEVRDRFYQVRQEGFPEGFATVRQF